jgi:magnesium chelatase subunit I
LCFKANRGIFYIVDVNLLDDHLVDILLDSAASGWNIEREESQSSVTLLISWIRNPEGGITSTIIRSIWNARRNSNSKDPILSVKL